MMGYSLIVARREIILFQHIFYFQELTQFIHFFFLLIQQCLSNCLTLVLFVTNYIQNTRIVCCLSFRDGVSFPVFSVLPSFRSSFRSVLFVSYIFPQLCLVLVCKRIYSWWKLYIFLQTCETHTHTHAYTHNSIKTDTRFLSLSLALYYMANVNSSKHWHSIYECTNFPYFSFSTFFIFFVIFSFVFFDVVLFFLSLSPFGVI